MKRFIIFFVAAMVCLSTSAQDLLVKRNGEKMKVKVLSITKTKVKFVRQGTEMPVYTLPISDIDYIEYPMGDRDTFGRAAAKQTSTPEKWHGATPVLQGATAVATESNSNSVNDDTYTIGEIYDKNGIRGIVVLLTDGGRHGVIMSLDEACLEWSTIPRKESKESGSADRVDGIENMKTMEAYITKNNLSWSDFPAFDWCRKKGEGWYLPAINELWNAGTMYLGGSRTTPNRNARKSFNNTLKAAGGQPLNNIMIYHSSTEEIGDARYSFFSHMSTEIPHTDSGFKTDQLFVRAFHRF